MIAFPHIDPVAIELGPLVIRWYALAYVAGIVLGYGVVKYLARVTGGPRLNREAKDHLITYAILGVLLGGRLGYVLFYNGAYYFENPIEIFKIWQGGMAFHGGALGVIVAFWFFARRYNLRYLELMDKIVCAVPIGLLFGRLANFVNGELYGRVTDVPWGMVFPHGGPEPRHPSQLYEAGLEGLLLFVVLFAIARWTRLVHRHGFLGGLFLAGYGAARFTVEFFREPDAQLGFLQLGMTMGQWLCVPMALAGIFLMLRALLKGPVPVREREYR